jgi:hypothetical protein
VITRKNGLSFPSTYLDIFLPSSFFFIFLFLPRYLYLMYNPTYPGTLYFALNGKRGERKKKKKLLAAACRLIMYITLYY